VFGRSVGGVTAWKPGVFAVFAAGLMSVFLVIRHTRADEEAGRLELIGSTGVGRQAALASGLLVAAVANVVVALLITAALVALGLPPLGSLAFALAIAGFGLVVAGVAAIAAQVASGARAAREAAIGAAAVAYLLRAFADSSGSSGPDVRWLTWVSPLGWSEQVRPFAGDRWWLLAVEGLAAVCCVVLAGALAVRRDHGAGLLPVRAGRPGAGPSLGGPFGLTWRLQRGVLLGWAAGFAAFGLVSGSTAKGVGSLLGGSVQLRHAISRLGGPGGLADAYLAAVMGIAGIVAAAYATSALLRLRSEEVAGRAEPLLASTAGRLRWGLSHVVVAASGTAVLLACFGLGAGVGYGLRGGSLGARVASLLGAGLAQLPAALVMAGVLLAVFGLRPRWAVACGWGALALATLLELFGPLFSSPQWVLDVSPFTHLPKLPGGVVSATPLAWLSAIAVAMAAMGMAGLGRRDIG
jgi:ABC-2 type transport system permease protein